MNRRFTFFKLFWKPFLCEDIFPVRLMEPSDANNNSTGPKTAASFLIRWLAVVNFCFAFFALFMCTNRTLSTRSMAELRLPCQCNGHRFRNVKYVFFLCSKFTLVWEHRYQCFSLYLFHGYGQFSCGCHLFTVIYNNFHFEVVNSKFTCRDIFIMDITTHLLHVTSNTGRFGG